MKLNKSMVIISYQNLEKEALEQYIGFVDQVKFICMSFVEDNAMLVMKEILVDDESHFQYSQQEMKLLKQMQHQHIVKYHDSFTSNSKFYIVMELCDKGDLSHYIARQNLTLDLPEVKIWRIVIQILLALQYIHSQGVIHSDLKPSNILMYGKDCDVKIADFGISQILTKNYNYSYNQVGTLCYCSPEICKGLPFNQKTDIWALGCIIYEICQKRRAYEGANDDNLKNKIINFQHPFISDEKYSPDLIKIYNMCMIKDQYKRPSASHILQNSYLKEQALKLGIFVTELENSQTINNSCLESQVLFGVRRQSNQLRINEPKYKEYLVDESINSQDGDSQSYVQNSSIPNS